MSKYRKIQTKFWNDAKIQGLSQKAKLLFLCILTHPHMTSIGLMRSSIPALAFELGMSNYATKKAFAELEALGVVEKEDSLPCIWAVNFIQHNMPESPNVIKSWAAGYEELPECELSQKALRVCAKAISSLPTSYVDAFEETFGSLQDYINVNDTNLSEGVVAPLREPFGKGCPDTFGNQEQEQYLIKNNNINCVSQNQEQAEKSACDVVPVDEPAQRPEVATKDLADNSGINGSGEKENRASDNKIGEARVAEKGSGEKEMCKAKGGKDGRDYLVEAGLIGKAKVRAGKGMRDNWEDGNVKKEKEGWDATVEKSRDLVDRYVKLQAERVDGCVIRLPLAKGDFYDVRRDELVRWQAAYMKIDVAAELKSFCFWLLKKDAICLNRKNISKGIENWLGNAKAFAGQRQEKQPEREAILARRKSFFEMKQEYEREQAVLNSSRQCKMEAVC